MGWEGADESLAFGHCLRVNTATGDQLRSGYGHAATKLRALLLKLGTCDHPKRHNVALAFVGTKAVFVVS